MAKPVTWEIPLPSARRPDYPFTHELEVRRPRADIERPSKIDEVLATATAAWLATVGLRGEILGRATNWGLRSGFDEELFASRRWTIGLRAFGVTDVRKLWGQVERMDAILVHRAIFLDDGAEAEARSLSAVSLMKGSQRLPLPVGDVAKLAGGEVSEIPASKFTATLKKLVTWEQWKRVPLEGTR